MTDELEFPVNFLENRDVVTKDGEFIGTWGTDETGAFYEFTPDGASEPMFNDPFMGLLAKSIQEWLDTGSQ